MKNYGVQAHRSYKGYGGCRKMRWSGIMRARLSEDGYWGGFLGQVEAVCSLVIMCVKEQI